jgi:4-hydroxy-3-methylbut-2-enyl diphosphate reductase
MKITIDKEAGFCFGVARSISFAEEYVSENGNVKCLGQIVHNEMEVKRLESLGVEFISREQFEKLKNTSVLIRAHGEPPETYEIAKQNNIKLIDATCPIVLSLQHKVYCSWEEISSNGGQVVIYGKKDHPEVLGLNGQTGENAIIIKNKKDVENLDFSRPIHLFAQTTKDRNGFKEVVDEIKNQLELNNKLNVVDFKINNSICKHVSNREEAIINIAKANDVVLFIAGKNSSNGRMLFEICKQTNKKSYFIGDSNDVNFDWFTGTKTIGITGATSTPQWLMNEVADLCLREFKQESEC